MDELRNRRDAIGLEIDSLALLFKRGVLSRQETISIYNSLSDELSRLDRAIERKDGILLEFRF